MDYPGRGGLTQGQLAGLTATALAAAAAPAGRPAPAIPAWIRPRRAGAIISYIAQAITARDQPAH